MVGDILVKTKVFVVTSPISRSSQFSLLKVLIKVQLCVSIHRGAYKGMRASSIILCFKKKKICTRI